MNIESTQLLYSKQNITIRNSAYIKDTDINIIFRKLEQKFLKYGFIKPYSLKYVYANNISYFSNNQFTSQLNKEYICNGYIHSPKKNDIYIGIIDIIRINVGIRCIICDIFNKKTNKESIILSVIIPIDDININKYNINDKVYIQLLDIKYENNKSELFSIGNIIPEDKIIHIQSFKSIINNIIKKYTTNIFKIKTELIDVIEITNNHLNLIYPNKYSYNKLVFSIYDFICDNINIYNNNIINESTIDNLYITYIYKK